MWKNVLSAAIFLSTACLASSNVETILNSESQSEAIVVTADQLEEALSGVNRAKGFHKKIWFVDNTNTNTGDGSYKNPFNTLIAAQNASKNHDIIFVFPGDNTTRGMDQGFVMKKGQKLLGAGVSHRISYMDKKLLVLPPSASLPLITNAAGGNGIILADSCEVSGIHLIGIAGGTAILGGDNNPNGPIFPGIKNTLIKKNLISNMTVLNGAIYLPNCEGKISIKKNTIFNILGTGSKTGIEIINQTIPVYSRIHIANNTVSNNGNTGITIAHNSPRGVVNAQVVHNTVFNIGQAGDGYFIGTQGVAAGGMLHVEIENNFCQNVIAHDLNVQSSGTAHVVAKVKRNRFIVSPLAGIYVASNDTSHLCLKLLENISDVGYSLNQINTSVFKLGGLKGNIGVPFTTTGVIQRTKCRK